MAFYFLPLLAVQWLFIAISYAVPGTYYPPAANCQEYSIPISFSGPVLEWVGPRWSDDYELMDFNSLIGTRSSAGFPAPITGPVDFNGSFAIFGAFCTPKVANNNTKTLLLATHGIGFDGGYWNIAYDPEEYNFVQSAISKGYSVFFYDRLGVGQSTKVSGYVNQIGIQIDILGQISKLLRDGSYTADLGIPSSIVLVGHSFGSFISNALLGLQPDAADAAVLTGLAYAENAVTVAEAFELRIASAQDAAFSDRDTGYLTWRDIYANIINFFKAPLYSLGAVEFAESHKQPFGILELLSILTVNYTAAEFTGPVMFLDGEFDFIVCNGFAPGVIEMGATTFPQAQPFESYVQQGAGHGLNYHLNATGVYEVAFDFLARHGF